MRIGNNYLGMAQLSSNKENQKNNPNAKAIADLLSGRRKNSYGVEGMRITGRTDWKRTIPVSDEMKQHVFEDVKKRILSIWGNVWRSYSGNGRVL